MRKLYQPFSVLNDVTFIKLKYDCDNKETHCHSFLEKRPYLVLYLGFRLAFTPRAKVNQAEFKYDKTKVTINLVFRSVTIGFRSLHWNFRKTYKRGKIAR